MLRSEKFGGSIDNVFPFLKKFRLNPSAGKRRFETGRFFALDFSLSLWDENMGEIWRSGKGRRGERRGRMISQAWRGYLVRAFVY